VLQRTGVRIALGLLLLLTPAAAGAAEVDQGTGQWAVTLDAVGLYGSPAEDGEIFGRVSAWAPLQILDYAGDWARVYNPRTRGTAYVPSAALAPSEAPSRYVMMAPPAVAEEFDLRGILSSEAPMAVYPTPAEEATQQVLRPHTWVRLNGLVVGEDASEWYLTDSGGYVPAAAVFVPERTDAFSDRWLDVDLSTPARVTAYEGGEVVNSFLAIKGTPTWPTPTGVFTIIRRVANETMNSDTIGIPRNGPGGYFLTNVLFTQYFTGSGSSFHYNYWSGNWGLSGSHGCLGLSYANSAFLWEWARIGTPVSIHY
jgi:hypothetical protein